MSKRTGFLILTAILLCLALLSGWAGYSFNDKSQSKYRTHYKTVEVVKTENGFVLHRNGKPYRIKGAGGYEYYDRIAAYGGNSIRVWHSDDAGEILDEAHRLGLSVTLGLWMEREREGFNYYDKKAVKAQLKRLEGIVKQHKDHPALLMWGVGNELYADGSNIKVWDAVNEVADMIHRVDPNHPTTTTVMNVPEQVINLIAERCPALDILSINAFSALFTVTEELNKTDWKGPYLITEFGARGYWESFYTNWLAPIEQTSSQKAEFVKKRYIRSIMKDTTRCLGSYVFMWGYKHETTDTWFSLINQQGEETELVQVMREFWTQQKPQNRAPYIAYVTLDGKYDNESVRVKPGKSYVSKVFSFDPDQDTLQYSWEILPEAPKEDGNASKQIKPLPINGLIKNAKEESIQFTTPNKKGAYRLFCYVRDGKNNIATANFPFYVEE